MCEHTQRGHVPDSARGVSVLTRPCEESALYSATLQLSKVKHRQVWGFA